MGDVLTRRANDSWHQSDDERDIVHYFRLMVPAMGDYTFDLFEARHKPRALYPVHITFYLGESYDQQNEYGAVDEAELERILSEIFRHSETKAVIRTLQAQAADPDSRPPSADAEAPPDASTPTAEDEDDIPF